MQTLTGKKMTLSERVEYIEEQNKQLKRSLTLLVCIILALILMGAKTGLQDGNFRQITAEKITIVDSGGKELILIGSDNERTGIRMINKAGKRVLGLGFTNDEGESGILVADEEGRPRIGLGMDEGVPGVALVSKTGKKILAMGGDERGYGLSVMDENEMQRASIGYKEGYTGVIILDDEGQYVRGMIRDANGSHYLSYMNEQGKEIIER